MKKKIVALALAGIMIASQFMGAAETLVAGANLGGGGRNSRLYRISF